MKHVYILVNKSRILLGCFSSIKELNLGIAVCRADDPGCRLYYQKVAVNLFDSTLMQFWTMHPEKLIEIDPETSSL